MFDHIVQIKSSLWMINRFRNAKGVDEQYNTKTWQPTQGFIYASLLKYYYDVLKPQRPYTILSTGEITAQTYSSGRLTFTITTCAGTASSAEVYVGDKGTPSEVSGASSWEYYSSNKVVALKALPSPSNLVIIVLKWKIAGDINDDGTVDTTDLSLLNNAYGSTREPNPSPNWDPTADVNNDGIVNAQDLEILGKNFGKTS